VYLAIYFELYPGIFIILMSVLGLLVGSFLNVVIYRLPVMMKQQWREQCHEFLNQPPQGSGLPGIKPFKQPLKSRSMPRFWKGLQDSRTDNGQICETFNLFRPRSRCPNCKKLITAFQNIPVISYLFLKGRCSNCRNRISIRYPLIELVSAILTGFIAWHFGYSLQTMFAVVLTWSLICLSMIDFDHQLLPDDITMPLLWMGIVCNIFSLFTNIYSSLSGAILGYGILWLIFISFKLLTGKEGMGYGDFKLLAMLGAWLGWEMLPFIVLLSSMLGAVIGVSLIFTGKLGRNIPIPFGPYLAVAGWIALVWGREITDFYLKLV